MKITQEEFEKIKKTQFLRPKFANIKLEYVHTKLQNKKKRRGNYRFEVTLPYMEGEDIENIKTHFALQPNRSPFFITHTLETGQLDLRSYLEAIEENQAGKINGNAVLLTEESVINQEKLTEMKKGLIKALLEVDRRDWKLVADRICIIISEIGVYKFKPLF